MTKDTIRMDFGRKVRQAGILLGMLVLMLLASAAIGQRSASAHTTGEAHAHEASAQAGSCEAAGLITLSNGSCTHGPDPAPAGVDTSVASSVVYGAAADDNKAICDGNGTSGTRVQVLYVRPSNAPDNFTTYQNSFRVWASDANDIYMASARETNGQRYIRFVHGADCTISVKKVTIDPYETPYYFDETMNKLEDLGYDDPARKYLIFLERSSPGLCGVGNYWFDYQPGQYNLNNQVATYAVVFAGCWDNASTPAHELTHALGAVLDQAPNATPYGHCLDDYDVMCYNDGGGQPAIVCPDAGHELRLDCNHDDYFHTNPPTGNYLKTHWNVANSSWLGTSTARIALDKTSSKYNGWVTASLSGFSPNKRIYLTFDGSELTSVVSDATGTASVQFRTPLTVFGDHALRAKDAGGGDITTTLRVIPRILFNEYEVGKGGTVRVYFYGFAAGETIEVWFYTSDTQYKVLTTITIASNGRGSKVITIPSNATLGKHLVRGKVVGVSRSASDSLTVTAPTTAEETPTVSPSPSPTATVTATPVPTGTPEPTATPTTDDATATPTVEAPTESPTPETPTDTPTPELPTETPTLEPPTDSPTPDPTATETPEIRDAG